MAHTQADLNTFVHKAALCCPISSSDPDFNRQISPPTQTHNNKSRGIRWDFEQTIMLVLHAQSTACKPAVPQHTKRGSAPSCTKGSSFIIHLTSSDIFLNGKIFFFFLQDSWQCQHEDPILSLNTPPPLFPTDVSQPAVLSASSLIVYNLRPIQMFLHSWLRGCNTNRNIHSLRYIYIYILCYLFNIIYHLI